MRKYLLFIAIIQFSVIGFAQDKTGVIKTGKSYTNLSFDAGDTLNESSIYWIEITAAQNYQTMQSVYIDIDSVSGSTPNVYIAVSGKLTSSSSWTALGDSVNWKGSADTTFTMTFTTPTGYRYYKISFRSDATDQQSLISDVQFKQWFTGGAISGSTITDGTMAFTAGAGSGITTLDMSGDLTAGSITSDADINVLDEQELVIGTTTTNAETKITAEFDEATTGVGIFRIGDLTNPQVLNTNPGAAVIPSIISINHSAGAGNCDDLIASYDKVNVIGAGDADITIVGSASRAYVGASGVNAVADEAYGAQPWVKHEGTGAIVAMSGLSAKLDVSADAFTATTVNAGHFHIEGASTVTGSFDGVMIEVYPDVTSMDNALDVTVDVGASVQNGIGFTGTYANAEISLSNGETIDNATDGVTNLGNSNIRGATWNFCDATGVGGTATSAVTLDYTPDLPALQAGLMIMFVAEGANTTTLTIAVDGGAAKNVYEQAPGAAPSALNGSEINTGSMVMAVYDGTQWVLISPTGN